LTPSGLRCAQELEQMKKKLKEMEGEAEKLRKIHEETEENAESASRRRG